VSIVLQIEMSGKDKMRKIILYVERCLGLVVLCVCACVRAWLVHTFFV
jgi:hypothetical protein